MTNNITQNEIKKIRAWTGNIHTFSKSFTRFEVQRFFNDKAIEKLGKRFVQKVDIYIQRENTEGTKYTIQAINERPDINIIYQ